VKQIHSQSETVSEWDRGRGS